MSAPAPSAGRALAYLFQRYVLRRRFLSARAEPYGLHLRVSAPDAAGRHLYKRGTYEPELTRIVLDHVRLPDRSIALDVGANLGWYSLLLATRFPTARIYAFEPEPLNFELLRHNLSANGCSNAHPQPLAAAESAGELELYPYADKNRGRHSLLQINDGPPMRIRAVRLDDFVRELGTPFDSVAFLKIDIEGYEYHALRGAPGILASVPLILSEFSPEYMRRGGVEPGLYLDLLAGAGLTPFECRGGMLAPVRLDELRQRERQTDLLWRRDRDKGA